MHEIKIKKLTFSNILSYGNNVNEFVIKDGICWIKGPNGAGKSTIIEALTFALFNRPYRNINKEELKNSANKSKLKVELEFDRVTAEQTDTYTITREMGNTGTTKTEIVKNNEVEKKEAGFTQKKLETEVLGFDQSIFENIISLNTIQTTAIIDMESKDKRGLVESVLTLHIDKYKEINKKAIKEAQTKLISANSDFTKYSKDVVDLKEILKQLEKEKEDNKKDIENQINEIVKQNKSIEDQLKAISSEVLKIKDIGIKKKEEYKKYEDILNKLSSYQIMINDVEIIEGMIRDKNDKINELKELIEKNEGLLKELGKIKEPDENKLKECTEEIRDLNTKTIDLTSKIMSKTSETSKIEHEITLLKPGVECPTCKKISTQDDIEKIKISNREIWKKIKSEQKDLEKQLKKIQDGAKEKETIKTNLEKDRQVYIPLKINHTSSSNLQKKVENDIKIITESINKRVTGINEKWVVNGNTIDSNTKDFCPTISIIEDKINNLKKDNEAGNIIKKELDSLREDLIKKNETIKNLNSNTNVNNKAIAELNKKIDEKSKNNINSAYNSTKNKIEGTEKDVETAKHRITKYSDEIEVTKCIERIYADDGIKKLVLGIFVPNLNKAIAHNLSMFELPFLIEFDDSMEYRFLSKFGLSTTYNGLSQGQKRKLNFAISMAFRDFVTAIADFKINILFLDEVLDISTDYEALNHMLVLLKNKVIEIGSIYLMTHRGDDFKDNFNHIIEIEHDGRYSSLKIV